MGNFSIVSRCSQQGAGPLGRLGVAPASLVLAGLMQISNMSATVIGARQAGPEQFTSFAVLFAIAAATSPLLAAGLDTAGARGIGLARRGALSYIWGCMLVSLGCAAVAAPIGKMLGAPVSSNAAFAVAALSCSLAVSSVFLSQPPVIARPLFSYSLRMFGAATVLCLVLVSVFFLDSATAITLALCFTGGQLLTAAVALRTTLRASVRREVQPPPECASDIPISERARFTASTLLSVSYNTIPVVAVSALAPATIAGNFAAVHRIMSGPVWLWTAVQSARMNALTIPIYDPGARSRLMLHKLPNVLAVIFGLIGVITALLCILATGGLSIFELSPPSPLVVLAVAAVLTAQAVGHWRSYHDRITRPGGKMVIADGLRLSLGVAVIGGAVLFDSDPVSSILVFAGIDIAYSLVLYRARTRSLLR
jgi:hypothetical protein